MNLWFIDRCLVGRPEAAAEGVGLWFERQRRWFVVRRRRRRRRRRQGRRRRLSTRKEVDCEF